MAVRVMVWFVVWWLARLPVAVPDFHEVDHHHESGQTCLYHEHLSRWHEADSNAEQDHQALLHWHWLIPGWTAQDYQQDDAGDEPDSGLAETDATSMIVPEHDRFDVLESFINENAHSEKPLVSGASQGDSLKENGRRIQRTAIDLAFTSLVSGVIPLQANLYDICHLITGSKQANSGTRPMRC
jgi:hypothetical protein